MRLTVQVTQDDIDAGVRDSCSRCPVAFALQRLANVRFAIVNKHHATVVFGNDLQATVNEDARSEDLFRRIHRFDLHGRMEPFSFSINVPPADLPVDEDGATHD